MTRINKIKTLQVNGLNLKPHKIIHKELLQFYIQVLLDMIAHIHSERNSLGG